MPYTRIWIHLIWSTKHRQPLLADSFRNQIFQHIRENAKTKDLYIDHINGTSDHVHLLISLPAHISLSEWIRLIKGESSRWINLQGWLQIKFAWQEEYIAISYHESELGKVCNYIRNQEEHHRLQTFQEEYQRFLEKYDFAL